MKTGAYYLIFTHQSARDAFYYLFRDSDFDDMDGGKRIQGEKLSGLFIFAKEELLNMVEQGRDGFTRKIWLYPSFHQVKKLSSKRTISLSNY